MNSLLTQEEIQFIIEDSNNSDYTIENLVHPSSNKTDVMKVSKDTGLILFYGNASTGFKHILERHDNVSLKAFWKENNKLETPSKFPNEIAPFHYLKIADQIYKEENLNLDKNSNSDNFILYVGECVLNGTSAIYRLILYKGTKIIHTLYPSSNVNNLKLNTGSFARGSVSFSNDFQNSVISLKIPYKNIYNEVVYEIVIIYKEIEFEKLVKVRKYVDGKISNQKEIERSKFNHRLDPIFLLAMQYMSFKEYESKFSKL